MQIQKIIGREILDSRGNPTVQVKVILRNGLVGVASVPSGASTGIHEALELRDGGKRYLGQGVLKAVANVNGPIAKLLVGYDVTEQKKIDEAMLKLDNTKNKSKLGANAILGVSLACARAGALAKSLPLYKYIQQNFQFPISPPAGDLPKGDNFQLPIPTMNILNGGKHADSGLEVQEFMIVPQQKTLAERVRAGAEVFHTLKSILKKAKLVVSVGDEGGFAPRLKNNEEALKNLVKAIKLAGYVPGKDVALAIDVASSEFFDKGKYNFEGKKRTADEMAKIYFGWLKKYPLISLEDPFAEDDWSAWSQFTETLKRAKIKTLLVGDDLFVTNVERLKTGIKKKAGSAILIKLNQIGTLTETISAIRLAQKNGYAVNVSHRSGETADTFIADLAVATGAEYIKTGSLSRSERVEKYNRLMEIEQEL